jgi:hypothetical protein
MVGGKGQGLEWGLNQIGIAFRYSLHVYLRWCIHGRLGLCNKRGKSKKNHQLHSLLLLCNVGCLNQCLNSAKAKTGDNKHYCYQLCDLKQHIRIHHTSNRDESQVENEA